MLSAKGSLLCDPHEKVAAQSHAVSTLHAQESLCECLGNHNAAGSKNAHTEKLTGASMALGINNVRCSMPPCDMQLLLFALCFFCANACLSGTMLVHPHSTWGNTASASSLADVLT